MAVKVKGGKLIPDGRTAGVYHEDPRLNSMIYDVEFPDGQIKEYSANMIAENILTQIDSKVMSTTLMELIADFEKDDSSVSKQDEYLVTPRGQRRMRKNYQGLVTPIPLEGPVNDMDPSQRSLGVQSGRSSGICKSAVYRR